MKHSHEELENYPRNAPYSKFISLVSGMSGTAEILLTVIKFQVQILPDGVVTFNV